MVRNAIGETGRRNAEVLAAMGMAPAMQAALGRSQSPVRRRPAARQRRDGGFGALSRVLRMVLQSAVLGVGAYLVIRGEASAGIIIAGSILASRALAPVELAIANWRGFVAARQSWQRLRQLLRAAAGTDHADGAAGAERACSRSRRCRGTAPGEQRLIVQDVAFQLKAGQGLGIIGPSASGKSSLARLLVGVWQPVRGSGPARRRRARPMEQRRRSAATSATCRRTSSCSPAPSPRTSPASIPTRPPKPIVAAARRRPACTT